MSVFKMKTKDSSAFKWLRMVVFSGVMTSSLIFMSDPYILAQTPQKPETKPSPLTVSEAVRSGLATNPDYASSINSKAATEQELRQARAQYLPSIDLEGDYGVEYSRNPIVQPGIGSSGENLTRKRINIQATQLVFDGLETIYEIDRQKARIKAAGYDVAEVSEQTALDIISAYIEILRQRDILDIAGQNVQKHIEILRNIRQSTDAGRTSQVDVDQVEARLASAKSQMATAQQNLSIARSEFKRVAGQEGRNLIVPDDVRTSLHEDVESQIDASLTTNPAISQAQADLETAEAEYKQTIAPYLPSINIEASAEEAEDIGGVEGIDRNASVLGVVNWNLYSGGEDSARRKEFDFRLKQARAAKAQTIREVEDTIRTTWAQMKAAAAREDNFRIQARANNELVEAYLQQFNLNRRTLLDVLDVQSEAFTSRSNVINERSNRLSAAYSLLAVEGRLLETLGISENDVSQARLISQENQ